jgi:hypothetical protein
MLQTQLIHCGDSDSTDAKKEIDRILRSGELEFIPIALEEILSEERLIRVWERPQPVGASRGEGG